MRDIPQGLKPHCLWQVERPKAEALGYLEAKGALKQKLPRSKKRYLRYEENGAYEAKVQGLDVEGVFFAGGR